MDFGENVQHDEKKRKYDIIVFGSSGFTGRFVVVEMYRFSQTYDFTWAVAGRDTNKLRTTLDDAWQQLRKETESANVENTTQHGSGGSLGHDKPRVDIIHCDVSDVKTVAEMAQAAKVVINCVGPYRLYGETVVEQCVSNGTHYVDVTGESLFMDHMAYEYNGPAKASGSVVVNALGMESVPSDLGVEFLYKHFKGRLWDVDVYMKLHNAKGRNAATGGAMIHDGTWKSALLHMAETKQRRRYRALLDESMPGLSECRPNPDTHKMIHTRRIGRFNDCCLKFPEPDQSLVARSIHHARTVDGLPYDFHVRNYVVVGGVFTCILALFVYVMLSIVVVFGPIRNLFTRYPRVFTLGIVSESGPEERTMKDSIMTMTLIGCGWTRRGDETAADGQNGKFNATRKTVVKVVAPNPGYGFTSKSVVLSAITILKDGDRIPNGGVLTPASAFRHTKFVDRLIEHGAATFKVVSDVIEDGDNHLVTDE